MTSRLVPAESADQASINADRRARSALSTSSAAGPSVPLCRGGTGACLGVWATIRASPHLATSIPGSCSCCCCCCCDDCLPRPADHGRAAGGLVCPPDGIRSPRGSPLGSLRGHCGVTAGSRGGVAWPEVMAESVTAEQSLSAGRSDF